MEGYATRLQDVLDLHEGDFLLRVRGDSMLGIGIYPGDLVVIHPTQAEPHPGEIVLVLLPDEESATLKRWHRLNGTVSLISENPAYLPMTFKAANVQIQGCLVGHIGIGRARRSITIQGD
ncbi:LexA family transcriptional regulator [Deinococcus sp. QL22]|uniref:LexA family protein n=1 Tax=Deinococcus sp. QL22 TaxID=2939437 RepID=UPI002016DEFC|nr:S24 family peptidase [Deinococcus sp. QL22]UQN10693.1 peptidase S24, LexA repressor [Deinococcus sp. QL22]